MRRAARERYFGGLEERSRAMQAVAGMWADRADLSDAETCIRKLRRGDRLTRLQAP